MKYLEELEKKVLHIVQKNKELQKQVAELSKSKGVLEEQVHQLEATLLKESNASQVLAGEKTSIKNSIEKLLTTISALENAH